MQDFETKVVAGAGTTNRLLAAEFNQLATELENFRNAGGLSANSGVLTQLAASVTSHALRGNFYVDSGAANTYVLTPVGSFVAPTSYLSGQLFRFIASNSNTGSSTINVASIGVTNLVSRNGTALRARDITANDYVEAYYTGTEVRIINSAPLYEQFSYNYDASSAPIYASSTTLTVNRIACRDYLDGININKTSASTLNIATYGLGGIIQSTNRVGTVTFTSGTNTLSAAGVDLTTIFQQGDVIEADGASLQARRIISLTASTAVLSDNWTVSGTSVTYRRGGRALNTPYLIYAYTNNGNVGLMATTRNIAIGDLMVDTIGGLRFQLLGVTKGSGECGYCFSLGASNIINPFKWVGNKCYFSGFSFTVTTGTPNTTSLPNIIPIGGAAVSIYSTADTSVGAVGLVSTEVLPAIAMYGETGGGSNQIGVFSMDVPIGGSREISFSGSVGPIVSLGVII